MRKTMSTMFKYTAPVTKSELERIVRIVSSKAKKIYTDPCNVGRDVISIIMSLIIMYLKDYTQEVELAWATRLGPKGLESLKSASSRWILLLRDYTSWSTTWVLA